MNEAEYKKLAQFETGYWWFVARRRLVQMVIKKYVADLSETSRYLDVGCGTGVVLRELGREFADPVGIDISPTALGLTRRRTASSLVAGDAWRLPFADGSFDLVTCLDVLEHVRNDLDAIRECYRVLRPRGCVVVSVPALDFLWSEHDEAVHHLRRYSRVGLNAKLAAGGFKVVKTTYAVSALCLPIFLVNFISAFRRRRLEPRTMLKEIPDWFNRLLITLHGVENRIARVASLPFGTGLVCIARKP